MLRGPTKEGSPFISLTYSPGRAYHNFKDWADQIALIDHRKLEGMGIHVGQAVDVAEVFKVLVDLAAMTDSNYLSETWIPAECVISTLAWPAFEKVLIEEKIVDKREWASSNELRKRDANWVKVLFDFLTGA
jgi:hypothetical protein